MDAGSASDGGDLDGGVDAGATRDAGRVLTIIDRLLFIQPDGGINEFPNDGETVTAVFTLPDAGNARLPMFSDGGGLFVVECAPAGRWVADVNSPGSTRVLIDLLDDSANVSSTNFVGRPGPPVSASTYVALDLTARPAADGDSFSITSRSAGTSISMISMAGIGSTQVFGQWYPDVVSGTSIRPEDDVRVAQLQFIASDAGVMSLSAMVGAVQLTGLTVPGDVVTGVLSAPPLTGSVTIRAEPDAGAEAGAGALTSCDALLFDVARSAKPAGIVPLASMQFGPSFSGRVEFPALASDAPTGAQVLCQAPKSLQVPLRDGGFESTDAGIMRTNIASTLTTIALTSIDGGSVSTRPGTGIPTNIRVDGNSGPGVIHTAAPTISWSPPTLGPPTRYAVTVRRISRAGLTFVRADMFTLRTSGTQVQIPSGLLVPGERYTFQVTSVRLDNPDPERPFRQTIPYASATTHSEIFAVE